MKKKRRRAPPRKFGPLSKLLKVSLRFLDTVEDISAQNLGQWATHSGFLAKTRSHYTPARLTQIGGLIGWLLQRRALAKKYHDHSALNGFPLRVRILPQGRELAKKLTPFNPTTTEDRK